MADGVRGDGYYRFFPGDHMRNTASLSVTEDGAYRRLLDAYYAEGSLTSDRERLYRIARTQTEEEKKAVDFVVERFFQVSGDRLLQNRVERELAERRAFLDEQSRKGRLSGAARRRGENGVEAEPEGEPKANHGSIPGSTGVQPGHEPEGEPKANQASASASAPRSGSPSPKESKSTAYAPDGANKTLRPPPAESQEAYFARVGAFFKSAQNGDLTGWQEAYPAVDLLPEIARAREWLLSHPKQRKKDLRKFLVNWLNRSQASARLGRESSVERGNANPYPAGSKDWEGWEAAERIDRERREKRSA